MVVETIVPENVEINKIRSFLTAVTLPFQVDNSTEITALNISTGEPVKTIIIHQLKILLMSIVIG